MVSAFKNFPISDVCVVCPAPRKWRLAAPAYRISDAHACISPAACVHAIFDLFSDFRRLLSKKIFENS